MKTDEKLMVIKCGGSTLDELPDSFYQEIIRLQQQGIKPVIVHGGGPAISRILNTMNIEPRFKDGMRITDRPTLDVVQMVLIGQTNKQIVTELQKAGGKAAGISGIDGKILQAMAWDTELGYVGKIMQTNVGLLHDILEKGYIPVLAPLGIDPAKGQVYNINADTAAGAVASALGAKRLMMVTDVPGVMKEQNGNKKVIPTLSSTRVNELIEDGTIYGGMIPKVKAALDGLQQGLEEVVIMNGKEPGVLTMVVKHKEAGTRIIKEGVTVDEPFVS